MDTKILITIVFILIIAIIILSKDIMITMAIVSLMANFLVIGSQIMAIHKRRVAEQKDALDMPLPVVELPPSIGGSPSVSLVEGMESDAGPQYPQGDGEGENAFGQMGRDDGRGEQGLYIGSSADPMTLHTVNATSMDLAGADLTLGHVRDKRCIDAKVAKTAHYFRPNYVTEFDESYAQQWWGQNE